MSFSGRVCKSAHGSQGSRAHVAGAQLVSASVAPLAWLQARRRDLSTIGPNGVHRRCSPAGRWMLNGRFGDEYGSNSPYGSVTGTYTPRRAVSLGSPRGLSRSSWPATCYLAPAAVGTSPTGLSGTAASRGVRARRRAVGPTRWLCFVSIRYKVPGPLDRSPKALRTIADGPEILTPTVGVSVRLHSECGKGVKTVLGRLRPGASSGRTMVRAIRL